MASTERRSPLASPYPAPRDRRPHSSSSRPFFRLLNIARARLLAHGARCVRLAREHGRVSSCRAAAKLAERALGNHTLVEVEPLRSTRDSTPFRNPSASEQHAHDSRRSSAQFTETCAHRDKTQPQSRVESAAPAAAVSHHRAKLFPVRRRRADLFCRELPNTAERTAKPPLLIPPARERPPARSSSSHTGR